MNNYDKMSDLEFCNNIKPGTIVKVLYQVKYRSESGNHGFFNTGDLLFVLTTESLGDSGISLRILKIENNDIVKRTHSHYSLNRLYQIVDC